MKKVCWLVFFTSPMMVSAQYERILNNPDVIWAAEIDIQYNLRANDTADSIIQNEIIFWKNFDPKNQTPHEGAELLMENILNAARTGQWPAWQLADTVRQLTPAEVTARLDEQDTIDVMDVETGLFATKAVLNEVDIASFFAIRAKQLLWYNEKKGSFELYTSAIGPVRRVTTTLRTKTGEWEEVYLYDYVPFWLKMPEVYSKKAKKSPNLNHPDITWAARLKTLGNSPELEKQQPFKNTKPPVMQILIDRFLTDPAYQVQNALEVPIRFGERNSMIYSVDTLVFFDPETYEEKVQIQKNAVTAAEIPRLRLVENWLWDDRKHRLYIRLERFAPMVTLLDAEGNYRFEKPLFYR